MGHPAIEDAYRALGLVANVAAGAVVALAAPLILIFAQGECESRTPAALRDTLLSKLISGEILATGRP